MLQVYSTLSRKKENFTPREGDKVNMFVCGPTVYDYAHLGHARSYVAYDFIVKYLRYKGYKVFYLQNITDIDDKIIQRAQETNQDPKKLAEQFEEEYKKDMKALKVNSVDRYARATDYIPEIVSQVQRLQQKGFAYELDDGIYFDVQKFTEYGKLAKQPLEDLKAGARVEVKSNKHHHADFVLWKKAKPGEPKWQTELGEGRPGWHIEDTAIAEKHFGDQYDVHGGGLDLIRPHHEAEIAQMEAISGKKPYVKYWMHNGFVTINEEKMSKSLDNFKTIRQILENYDWKTVRFFLLATPYRAPINFTDTGLDNAKNSLDRIHDFILSLNNYTEDTDNPTIATIIKETDQQIEQSLDNDFETAKAFAAIFNVIKETNKAMAEQNLSQQNKQDIHTLIKKWNKVFEVFFPEENIPQEVRQLAEQRLEARTNKNWQKADELREQIKQKGYYIDDTAQGFQLKKR